MNRVGVPALISYRLHSLSRTLASFVIPEQQGGVKVSFNALRHRQSLKDNLG